MSKEKQRCSERIFENYHYYPCSRNGSVERDGKWYCKQHDPVAIKERNAAKQAKWNAEYAEADRKRKLASDTREAELQVIEALRETKRLMEMTVQEADEEALKHGEADGEDYIYSVVCKALAKLDALKAQA